MDQAKWSKTKASKLHKFSVGISMLSVAKCYSLIAIDTVLKMNSQLAMYTTFCNALKYANIPTVKTSVVHLLVNFATQSFCTSTGQIHKTFLFGGNMCTADYSLYRAEFACQTSPSHKQPGH